MSVNGVLNSAVSGLQASQTALRNTSTNIANVNTPGYARLRTEMAAVSVNGVGVGVEVAEVRRIADRFLQRATMQAQADAAGAERAFALLDRLQAEFGSMDDAGSLFGRLDASVSALVQVSATPGSVADRAAAVDAADALLSEMGRLSGQIQTMRGEADARIAEGVVRINELLVTIGDLNADVRRAATGGGDATGAENARAALVDELGALIDVRAIQNADGGLELRTSDGLLLLGQNAATLEYTPTQSADAGTAYPQIQLRLGNTTATPLDPHLRSGEIAALIETRDAELPAVAAELGELAAGFADALNAAHNDAAAVPAPNVLSGRNTGLLAGDALGFTGQATIGITAADGTLAHRIDIDFDAGTLSVDGGGATAFGGTVGGFAAALDGALGPLGGSASFAGGRLSVAAGAGEGLAIRQSETAPSDRGGRGLSHFFGLNDMIASDRPGFFETGLTGAEAHGFTPGQTLAFRVSAPGGAVAANVSVAVGGTTINDVLSQLNNPAGGLGRYATFSLDSAGALVMTPAPGAENLKIDLVGDGTRRGDTGVSFSEMFGLGAQARAGRAAIFSVREDIAADPRRLAAAAPELETATPGDFVLASGDGRGALALHSALTKNRAFSAAGGLSGGTMSVSAFAARLAGDVGARAAGAERALDSATALKTAADERRSNLEGVNLDEELANMTIYQQSYNASARLLQAAREMVDTLLSVV